MQNASSYAILAKLATGGMAEIFLARNASSAGVQRYVVLKRMIRAHDAEEVQMFLDEAKLAAQLQHPNIAQVYDTGKLGESFFFTMEYVHGETVRELLVRAIVLARELPIEVALTIVAGAAAGLHHAHERLGYDGKPLGIVHRDVSPSNLMVSYEGNVKVVDFGIAKASSSSTETRSGTVKGKIGYLSPEQCRGRTLDRRSDLFALGIVMWELLVRDRLYKRGGDFDNMEAILREDAPAPSSRRAGVPPDVDAIVGKLLARAPEQRFQTAAQLLDEIERVAAKHGWVLSTGNVARFMRGLFGTRREPWLELRQQAPRAETVTVTAQPLDTWSMPDDALSNVIDLSALTGATAMVPHRSRRRLVYGGAALGALAIVASAAIVLARGHDNARADSANAPVAQVEPAQAEPAKTEAVKTEPTETKPETTKPETTKPETTKPDAVKREPAGLESRTSHPTRVAPDVVALYREARYADVIAACTTKVTNATTCALAACRVNDVARAKRWAGDVPANAYAQVVAKCQELGTVIERAAPNPPDPKDCESNPLACRR